MSDHDDNNTDTNSTGSPRPLVAILAGGASRRMGGGDKGNVLLGGRRLVDCVVDRLTSQSDHIVFSGVHDYGFGFQVIEDRNDGPKGPAAGLWSVAHWIRQNDPKAVGFCTAPVDGPFLPHDLVPRLSAGGDCAIAVNCHGNHPTFAYWRIEQLLDILARCEEGQGIAVQQVAKDCLAKRIAFAGDKALMNINNQDDLKHAEMLTGSV